nr:molybdopterin-dependent oxidoreductase [Chloroflexota bacterium]
MANVIEFIVNGQPVQAEVADSKTTLLSYLRDVLHLTGPKNGCGQGHCGACTVIVNGKAQRSCLLRLERIAGAQVETVEGLAVDGRLHPLQEAFIEEGAIQCGFCTPGMLMASKALLDRNPDPTDEEIREALKDNLCRCTGYVSILRAVRKAAQRLRAGGFPSGTAIAPPTTWDVVGKDVMRKDAWAKVTGTLKYADDLYVPGMLHARALRSAYPHARILAIDTSDAEKVPGVVTVLTAKDVPGRNRFGLVIADQPVLADDRVRYIGDALACVYAESIAAADEALGKIKVDYEELEVVSTPQRAMAPDAPRIHENGNILAEHHVRKGDVEAAFRQADVIVENTYYTPFVEHAYLEPEACLARPDGEGGVAIWVGSQGPNVDRAQIAASLALPLDKVRVVHTPMGGGFGGKEDITVQILAALGALRTGRPVKMVLPRPESIRVSTKRHAEYLHYKTAATRDGKILAVEAIIIGDTGAYASVGASVLFRSATFACGPYVVPNVKVDAYAVYTNNPPAGAMRGFGSPQVAFAADCQMDELAHRLGMDPFEFRLRNALEAGAITATGQLVTESIGIKECLNAVRDALAAQPLPQPAHGKRLGVGIAAAYKNVGLGPGLDDRAGAIAEIDDEGHLILRGGCIDMGQGQDTVIAQIAAQTLQIPYSDIIVVTGDTASCPDSFMTTASRATLLQGNAVQIAVTKLREQLLDYACSQFDLRRDAVTFEAGRIQDKATGVEISLAELARQATRQNYRLCAEAYYTAPTCYRNFEFDERQFKEDPDQYRVHVAYSFCAQACILEVDESSGEVRVLRMITAQDVGKPIHPQNIRGQIEGGVVMGMGYALYEEFIVDRGYIVTDTLRKCKIPHIAQAPEIVPLIVEDPHSLGPFGAKGMAELSVAPSAPAIANAIHNALGVRIRELPITPEKILAALHRATATSG